MTVFIVLDLREIRQYLSYGLLGFGSCRSVNGVFGKGVCAAKDCAAKQAGDAKHQDHVGKIRFCRHSLFPPEFFLVEPHVEKRNHGVHDKDGE